VKKPWYAYNARKLLDARQAGMTPDDTVVVSMVDGERGDLTITADMPADRMDWRMLVNLDVVILADKATPLDRLLDTASLIAQARPRFLGIHFNGAHDVEVGTGSHFAAVQDIPAEHTFSWVPINCGGTLAGSQLRHALIQKHPRWTVL
jgi:hypothetical protein